jgi:hypothetical protein
VPAAKDEVVNVAEYTPGDTNVNELAVPKTVAPLRNSTVPVGGAVLGTLTCAVNVTGAPNGVPFVLRVKLVEVTPGLTVRVWSGLEVLVL